MRWSRKPTAQERYTYLTTEPKWHAPLPDLRRTNNGITAKKSKVRATFTRPDLINDVETARTELNDLRLEVLRERATGRRMRAFRDVALPILTGVGSALATAAYLDQSASLAVGYLVLFTLLGVVLIAGYRLSLSMLSEAEEDQLIWDGRTQMFLDRIHDLEREDGAQGHHGPHIAQRRWFGRRSR